MRALRKVQSLPEGTLAIYDFDGPLPVYVHLTNGCHATEELIWCTNVTPSSRTHRQLRRRGKLHILDVAEQVALRIQYPELFK